MLKSMAKYVVLTLLLMGCAGLDMGKENWKKFEDTSRAYLMALRWGEYETAYGFKRPPNIDDEIPDFHDLRDVRVASHRVKQTIISEDQMTVKQIVDFQYYRMRNVTVKTITDRQKWEYDEGKKRWYLISDLPNFE
ncbi:MAG: hypothetical protein P8185_08270 [Deltaproteobacteria bacterium]|jgi:hypothetical protein